MDSQFLLDTSQFAVLNRKSLTICLLLWVCLTTFLDLYYFVFISDLPEKVDCQDALFDDDTLMYQAIKCLNEVLKFQENLRVLSKWADKWEINFNNENWKFLLFNCKDKFPHYLLHWHELEIEKEVRYPGGIIQPDIKFTVISAERSRQYKSNSV